jgi:hypothetical protein
MFVELFVFIVYYMRTVQPLNREECMYHEKYSCVLCYSFSSCLFFRRLRLRLLISSQFSTPVQPCDQSDGAHTEHDPCEEDTD